MARTFNAYEKATIKNSAKAVAHYQAKNLKLEERIEELRKEQEMNNTYIEQYSKPVKDMTGYEPLELCEKKSRGTQNDWVFIYPDTIVPPTDKVEEAVTQERPKNLQPEGDTLPAAGYMPSGDSEEEPSQDEEKEEADAAPGTEETQETEVPENEEDDDIFRDDEF